MYMYIYIYICIYICMYFVLSSEYVALKNIKSKQFFCFVSWNLFLYVNVESIYVCV